MKNKTPRGRAVTDVVALLRCMSRGKQAEFYTSLEWRRCREAYKKSVGGLCELCKDKGLIVPGKIVHHVVHITPENVDNPEITLNFSNLKLLCMDCHAEVHGKPKRYVINADGSVECR